VSGAKSVIYDCVAVKLVTSSSVVFGARIFVELAVRLDIDACKLRPAVVGNHLLSARVVIIVFPTTRTHTTQHWHWSRDRAVPLEDCSYRRGLHLPHLASLTEQCTSVPVMGQRCAAAGKVAVGLHSVASQP